MTKFSLVFGLLIDRAVVKVAKEASRMDESLMVANC